MIGFISKENWVEEITDISEIQLTPREVLNFFGHDREFLERNPACVGKLNLLTLREVS